MLESNIFWWNPTVSPHLCNKLMAATHGCTSMICLLKLGVYVFSVANWLTQPPDPPGPHHQVSISRSHPWAFEFEPQWVPTSFCVQSINQCFGNSVFGKMINYQWFRSSWTWNCGWLLLIMNQGSESQPPSDTECFSDCWSRANQGGVFNHPSLVVLQAFGLCFNSFQVHPQSAGIQTHPSRIIQLWSCQGISDRNTKNDTIQRSFDEIPGGFLTYHLIPGISPCRWGHQRLQADPSFAFFGLTTGWYPSKTHLAMYNKKLTKQDISRHEVWWSLDQHPSVTPLFSPQPSSHLLLHLRILVLQLTLDLCLLLADLGWWLDPFYCLVHKDS